MIKTDALIAKFEEALADNYGYIWGKTHEWWTKEKQAAYVRDYKDDPDRAQSCEYGGKWAGHYVTDCSGLFAWAFSCLGGKMYHGSNTMWNSWCSAKGELSGGKRKDGKPLKPGTAVFTYNKSTGKRGHVGLFIGNGLVIEAQGSKSGVVRSKVTLSKWVEWGELKGVDYGSNSSENASNPASGSANEKTSTDTMPTLKRGSKGEYVTLLQAKLIQKGYDLGKWGADGDFGAQTEKAVKEFQRDHALNADGVVGYGTWTALDEPESNLYTVTIPSLPKFKAEALVKNYSGASMKAEGR